MTSPPITWLSIVRREAWRFEWLVAEKARAFLDTAEWQEGFRGNTAHVFHRPEVLHAWYETVGVENTPVVIRGTNRAGARVALAAVAVEHAGRAVTRRSLEGAGQETFGFHQPVGALGAVDDWDDFWVALRASSPASIDQVLFRLMPPAFAGRHYALPRTEASPVLDLSAHSSLESVLSHCSANHRGDVRRRLRRLQEQGDVVLRVYGAADVTEAAAEFRDRFFPRWSEMTAAADWPIGRRPGLREFCDRLVHDGLRNDWAHFCALRVNGVAIAWHLGLVDRRRLYWWLPLHDRDWDAHSPGKVLLTMLIERLAGERWRELQFQSGAQPYKLAWAPEVPYLSSVRWHARTVRGRAIAAYDRMMARRVAEA
jgi:CelD/BcsL family acetyltransferase involved in cellulose biosynthesis